MAALQVGAAQNPQPAVLEEDQSSKNRKDAVRKHAPPARRKTAPRKPKSGEATQKQNGAKRRANRERAFAATIQERPGEVLSKEVIVRPREEIKNEEETKERAKVQERLAAAGAGASNSPLLTKTQEDCRREYREQWVKARDGIARDKQRFENSKAYKEASANLGCFDFVGSRVYGKNDAPVVRILPHGWVRLGQSAEDAKRGGRIYGYCPENRRNDPSKAQKLIEGTLLLYNTSTKEIEGRVTDCVMFDPSYHRFLSGEPIGRWIAERTAGPLTRGELAKIAEIGWKVASWWQMPSDATDPRLLGQDPAI